MLHLTLEDVLVLSKKNLRVEDLLISLQLADPNVENQRVQASKRYKIIGEVSAESEIKTEI